MSYQVQHLLRQGEKYCRDYDLPPIEARFLLQSVLNMEFSKLLLHYADCVDDEQIQLYERLLEKRKAHVPLQQLTNSQTFMGLDFYVNEHVLIPRPETEILVEKSLEFLKQKILAGAKTLRILDMCTGSGCILISLCHEIEMLYGDVINRGNLEIKAIGIDLSPEALKVSKTNEKQLLEKIKIDWRQGDLFQRIDDSERFTCIVSNPPYIPREEIETLAPEVKVYEPRMALDGGDDGLGFYRRISSHAFGYLESEGALFFEIGHGQEKSVIQILENRGFTEIKAMKDLAGLERLVYGFMTQKIERK